MTELKHEYTFTHHLRERFVQRTNKKYTHLQRCRTPDCETCKALTAEIKAGLNENRRPVDTELNRRISASHENRSYLNNTSFMQWYYDKYGYDKGFKFLVHEDMLFVVVVDNGKKIVVTCIPAKTHLAGKISFRPKFKKKEPQGV